VRVSSRTHYGLRAMTELAKAYGERTLSLSEIASVEHLPLPYLEQLVSPLRRVGLIEGTRGAHGGYRLTRSPGEITVGQIVRVLEGPDATAPVECLAESYVEGGCTRESACASRPLWARLKAAFDAVVDSTTLADLCFEGVPAPAGWSRRIELSPEMTCLKETPVPAHG
jgi:Rrf2 family transcriptional regulator, cysteine metabolism repressor